jgi:hypothetical protein
MPRNESKSTVSVSIDAKRYDALRAATKPFPTQEALARLVASFLALPKDAQQIMLADVTPKTRRAVLRALLRK